MPRELQSLGANLIQASYANSTLLFYNNCWAKLIKFLEKQNLSRALPLSPHAIALFLALLFQEGKSASTLRTNLSAISFKRKILGIHDPTKTFFLQRLLIGAKKSVLSLPKKRPISLTILKSLVEALPLISPTPFDRIMFKALFLVLYYACLRIGEVAVSHSSNHTIRLADVYVSGVTRSDKILLVLNSFKHSAVPSKLLLPIGDDKNNCPKEALINFLKVRPLTAGNLFIDASSKPITRYRVLKTLIKCLNRCGLDSSRYNTHSFRVGRASDFAANGDSEQIIRETGRWNSSAFLKYLRFDMFQLPPS